MRLTASMIEQHRCNADTSDISTVWETTEAAPTIRNTQSTINLLRKLLNITLKNLPYCFFLSLSSFALAASTSARAS